jgi:hypothetical protein
MLTRLNHDALSTICGQELSLVSIPKKPVAGLAAGARGYIDGLDSETVAGALEQIGESGALTIFIDGSNLGALVEAIKSSPSFTMLKPGFSGGRCVGSRHHGRSPWC